MLGAPRAVGIGKLPSLSIVLDSMVRHFYQLKMLDAKPQGGFRESRVGVEGRLLPGRKQALLLLQQVGLECFPILRPILALSWKRLTLKQWFEGENRRRKSKGGETTSHSSHKPGNFFKKRTQQFFKRIHVNIITIQTPP